MDTSPPVLNDDKGGVPSDSVTQIVTDGDVLLVVGPSQHKIQVSSHFLKHISPVFRDMLDAPMKEGEALANKCDDDAHVEIVFPEDKEQPMVQVLHTLYGSDPSARRFSKGDVKEIAILAEKYGMVERIAIFASFWLLVAYILKIDWAFFDITKTILQTRTSLLKFIGSFHDKHTGLRLGMALKNCAAPTWR
ncbi:SKP1/BTB/POZ domain superfamily [Fusarium oxysporum f. sp. vasinfectum]|nr:SKP1/BTB/POZ domain superfamily [Fusarium oxysporum f. sp. vasinfectum]